MSPRAPLALVAGSLAAASAYTLTLYALGPLRYGLAAATIFAWYTLPGFALAHSGPERESASLPARTIGALWSYALSTIVLLTLWVAGVRAALPLVIFPPLVAGALLFLVLRFGAPLPLPTRVAGDGRALLWLLLIVPLLVGPPFARVGELTPDGRTYRAYFTADFVWRMAVAGEVAHGEVPPKNQFYRGDDLRYYWMADLLPAVEHRMLPNVRLEQVLLVNALAVDTLFVAFLFAFARFFTRSPAAAAIGVAAVALFSSFEGIERIWFIWRHGIDWGVLRVLNIDAITRWIYGSLPVDGLQRVLWYQPQHATAYALSFAALGCGVAAARAPRPAIAILAGVSLGCALLFSSFVALMMIPVVGVVAAFAFARARNWRGLVLAAVGFAIPIGATAAAAILLDYVDRSEALVRVLVNPVAVTHPYIAIALSFGPVLPPIAAGLWLLARRDAWAAFALVFTILVAFLFYFFVDVRDHQYVYVGWRAGHFIFISAAALTAVAFDVFRGARPGVGRAALAIGLVLAVLAAPMTIVDAYNTQDTSNREMGPGFHWTLVLSPDELAALEWIKRYTPPTAVVQVEPHARDRETWAYVPAFAERRMAYGIPISMVPLAKYIQASEGIRAVYASTDPVDAHARAAALGIEYLIVAPPERQAFPNVEAVCNRRPDLFRPVFRNASVTIYFVERQPR